MEKEKIIIVTVKCQTILTATALKRHFSAVGPSELKCKIKSVKTEVENKK